MEDWKNWARTQKAEAMHIALMYSGSFMRSLVTALNHADRVNTEKILDTWSEEFQGLFKMWKQVRAKEEPEPAEEEHNPEPEEEEGQEKKE